MSQSKYWCVTVNNYDNPEEQTLYTKLRDNRCSYYVFGHEVGANGTPHLQGYIEFPAKKRLAWLKRNVHATAHFEKRRGTSEEAAEYCKKDDANYSEFGEMSVAEQGKRNDLKEATEFLREHSLAEVAQEHPTVFAKFHKGLQALKTEWDASEAKHKPEVIVYWGDTGLGKTYKVRKDSPDVFFVSNYKWYCGYDGIRDICFDEFNGQITISNFLRLIDRYAVRVETKGGSVNFNPKRIFICSHFEPKDWYKETPERFPELWRRITRCHHFRFKTRQNDGVRVTEVGGNTAPPLLEHPPKLVTPDGDVI